jgi:hypothetical protein
MLKYATIFLVFISTCALGQTHKDFGSVNDCYGKTFSIAAWVLTDTAGATNFTQAQLQEAIDSLNNQFRGICVDFKLCNYTELPNHRQDTIVEGIHDVEISTLYRKKNVINLYFATEVIKLTPPVGPCGYAPLGSNNVPSESPLRDAIILKKECFDELVLAHEVGHYFGLYHTFETQFGSEHPNGSNCATTGDLVCDTEADPNGTTDAQGCDIGVDQTHISGTWYTPPVCNIMSYYTPSCRQTFTIGQLNRMLDIMKTGRSYLW